MNEESAIIQAIWTYIGTFQVNRLAGDIKTRPNIFQSIMDRLLANLSGVATYFDDIVVRGATSDECYNRLIPCLEVLLGYVIEYNKILKNQKKISNVLDVPRPKNVEDVHKFLVLVT